MERSTIALGNFAFDHSIIAKRWLLLTAGEFAPGKFNSMTISWGKRRPDMEQDLLPGRRASEADTRGASWNQATILLSAFCPNP